MNACPVCRRSHRLGEPCPPDATDQAPTVPAHVGRPAVALAETVPSGRSQDDGAEPHPEPLPDLGAKFRVLRQLGGGGMGTVYEVEHLALGRRVAVKRIAAPFAGDANLIERLRREAQAAGSLGHENLVAVTDFDFAPDGRPYLVMELLSGENLRERLRRGRLTPAESVGIVGAVADGLASAHARGIVHRDVKPENIFLARGPSGAETAKLVDFGVARLREHARTITMAGEMVGTPAYLAPEQARGAEVDARADVHALGVVAYELLTGAQPFSARTIDATLARVLSHVPPPPSRAGAPPETRRLDEIVLRALEKARERRWPSAESFASSLRAAWSGQAVAGVRAARLRRALRTPWAWGLMVAVALGVLAGAGAAWLRARRRVEARAVADDAMRLIVTGETPRSDIPVLQARRALALAGTPYARAVLAHALVQRARWLPAGQRAAAAREGAALARDALEADPGERTAHEAALAHLNFTGDPLGRLRATRAAARALADPDVADEGRARFGWLTGHLHDLRAPDGTTGRPAWERRFAPIVLDYYEEGLPRAIGRLPQSARERYAGGWFRVWIRLLSGDVASATELRAYNIGSLDLTDQQAADAALAAASGDPASARAHLDALRRLLAEPDLYPQLARNGAVQLAQVAAWAKLTDRSLAALELANRLDYASGYTLDRDPVFDPIRAEPRFVAARDRIAARGDALWRQAAAEGLAP